MKSIFYDGISETHNETFCGAFDNLRNNDWMKKIGCPFNNKQLKKIEKNLKKGAIFSSNGTFGSRSVFYWDNEMKKFVLFVHRPKNSPSIFGMETVYIN